MTEYLNEIKKLMVSMIANGASMDEIERVSKHSATVIMSEKENGIDELFSKYKSQCDYTVEESDESKEIEMSGTKLEKAKQIIKKYFSEACCGLFFTRNWIGDEMAQIYKDNELTVDICYGYSYFEVFGLDPEEQEELKKYYNELKGEDE